MCIYAAGTSILSAMTLQALYQLSQAVSAESKVASHLWLTQEHTRQSTPSIWIKHLQRDQLQSPTLHVYTMTGRSPSCKQQLQEGSDKHRTSSQQHRKLFCHKAGAAFWWYQRPARFSVQSLHEPRHLPVTTRASFWKQHSQFTLLTSELKEEESSLLKPANGSILCSWLCWESRLDQCLP